MKSSVKLPLILSLIGAAFILPISEAAAQTVFMVQLGSFKSSDEAKSQWDKLTTTFPDLFQPLTYAPTEVMLPPDDFVYHRTQAGPIATREEADTICERVVAGGFECYVVETAMFTAPYSEADAQPTTESVSQPVAEAQSTFFDSGTEEAQPENQPEPQQSLEQALAEPTPAVSPAVSTESTSVVEAAPAPIVEATSVAELAPTSPASDEAMAPVDPAPMVQSAPIASPFGTGPSVPEGGAQFAQVRESVAQPIPSMQNVAGGQADVRVAEAIPVPLSNLGQATAKPYAGGFRGTPSSYNRTMALWAEIGYFESQRTALGYWNVLRQRDAAIPGGLRLRVTHPFTQKHLSNKMSLRVGPFTNVGAIRRLCSFTRPEKLGCRAIRDLGGSINTNAAAAAAGPSGSTGYAARRAALRGRGPVRAPFAPARAASMSSVSSSESMFWIQLGAFMAPQAALDKWSELQLLHKAELGTLNEQVYTPKGSRSLFRLRAGPFARAADAVATCEALKRKGTLCVVVSER